MTRADTSKAVLAYLSVSGFSSVKIRVKGFLRFFSVLNVEIHLSRSEDTDGSNSLTQITSDKGYDKSGYDKTTF